MTRAAATGPALAAAFLAVGLATLPDRAVTWDEPETLEAALRNVEIASAWLRGAELPRWPAHQIPGYYFAFDLARGLAVRGVVDGLGVADPFGALHAFHLLLAAGSLWLLFDLARALTGRARPALFAALALAAAPLFQSHAANSPKDLPALFAFLLFVRAALALVDRGRARDVAGSAAALGLALTTRAVSPLALPVLGLWLLLARPAALRRRAARLAVAVALGLLAALLLWPWLWEDPLGRLRVVLDTRIGHVGASHPVAYLGRTYPAPELPWHAFAVNLLARTPLPLAVLWLASVVALAAPRRERGGGGRGLFEAALLGWIWVAVLALAEAFAPARYDAGRHFLPILPGLALLAGVGLERATAALASRLPRPGAALALPGLVFGSALGAAIAIHPYPNAFLNAAANAWIGEESERYFELDYWGHAYPQGAAFLDRAIEPGARVFAPIGAHLVDLHLDRPAIPGPPVAFVDTTTPAYLIAITRIAAYDPATRFVARHFRPVYAIRRQRGTLLVIYKNSVRARP